MKRFVVLIFISSLLYFTYFAMGRGIPGDVELNGTGIDGRNNDSVLIVLKTVTFPFDLIDGFQPGFPLNISQHENSIHARDLPPHEFEMLKDTLRNLGPAGIQPDRLSYFAKALNLSGPEILELRKILQNRTTPKEQLFEKSRREVKEPTYFDDFILNPIPNEDPWKVKNTTNATSKSRREIHDPPHYEDFSTLPNSINTSTLSGQIEESNNSNLFASTPDLFINFHNKVENVSGLEKILHLNQSVPF